MAGKYTTDTEFATETKVENEASEDIMASILADSRSDLRDATGQAQSVRDGEEVTDLAPVPVPTRKLEGVFIGTVVAMSEDGQPLIDIPADSRIEPGPWIARATIPVAQSDVGREAMLVFPENEPGRPVLIGLIQSPASADDSVSRQQGSTHEANVDGKQIVFTAEREIVLECGKASITLTKAGKVLIRGTYVLSRSSGVNAVKGGSIELN